MKKNKINEVGNTGTEQAEVKQSISKVNNEYRSGSTLAKEFIRIWPEGKNTFIYHIIENKDMYMHDDEDYMFYIHFKGAVLTYDYQMALFNLRACNPTPDEIFRGFLSDVAKGIIHCCGKNVFSLAHDVYGEMIELESPYTTLKQIYDGIRNKPDDSKEFDPLGPLPEDDWPEDDDLPF